MAICAMLALAACGGGGGTASDEGSAEERASTKTGSGSDGPSGSEVNSEAQKPPKPPKVSVPSGPPPKQIVVVDLEKGKGKVLKWGTEMSVRYVAVDYKTGKVLET